MKPLYLAAALSLAAMPALAQQAPDPVQAFATTFDNASALLVNAAGAWAKVHRENLAELSKLRANNAALEARLTTAMEWLKQAQTGDSK